MLCREALTSFIREIVDAGLLANLNDTPKMGDFVAWSDRIVGELAAGGTVEYLRGYLRAISQKGWQLVNWLTHAKNATRNDAYLALNATEHIVENFTSLVLKSLATAPERCGRCQSYRITVTWRPDQGEHGEYVAQCDRCGAERVKIDQQSEETE